MTSIKKTFDVLDDFFITEQGDFLNHYFNEQLGIFIDNNREAQSRLGKCRNSVSISKALFAGLVDYVNSILFDWYPGYSCNNKQIKSWLEKKADGYNAFSELVNDYSAEYLGTI